MEDRARYQQPDLDSIEELNYISTVEEDEVIDKHIDTLREWGYGSITHVNDLHQLFWEFSKRDVVLDKLFRVAVVECIDEEPLYIKFLGMAKRYNGWHQRQIDQDSKQKRAMVKKLSEKKAQNEELKESLRLANASIAKLKKEKDELVRAQKPKKAGAIENELRQELKKEYSKKLTELRKRTKPYKILSKVFMTELMNPCSRFFESFDFSNEKDVDDYIELFRLAGRKINVATQKIIGDLYGEDSLTYLNMRVREYNEYWEKNLQVDEPDEE